MSPTLFFGVFWGAEPLVSCRHDLGVLLLAVQAGNYSKCARGHSRLWNGKCGIPGPAHSRNVPAREAAKEPMGWRQAWGALWHACHFDDGICGHAASKTGVSCLATCSYTVGLPMLVRRALVVHLDAARLIKRNTKGFPEQLGVGHSEPSIELAVGSYGGGGDHPQVRPPDTDDQLVHRFASWHNQHHHVVVPPSVRGGGNAEMANPQKVRMLNLPQPMHEM